MSKTIRIVIIVVIVVLLIWPLLALSNWLTGRSIYYYFVNSLADKLGWNKYLIQAMVMACLVPFFYAVKLFFSPLNQKKRRRGAILMTSMAVAYNLALYFALRDVAFGFGHRQVLKYYSRTDKGIVFYDRPGFDPATGQELKPVTPEVVRDLIQLREGPLTKIDPANVAWFNPYTGAPQVWYYRFPDGELEFYNRPGMHPQTGDQLLPVTKELYMNWRGSSTTAVTHAALNRRAATDNDVAVRGNHLSARMQSFRTALVANSGHGDAGLLAIGRDEVAQKGADALTQHLPTLNSNALRAALIRQGGFGSQLYAGDPELLREAMAVTGLGSLLVAQVTVSCEKRSEIDPDLLSCDLTANARRFDASGNPAGYGSSHATGAGFSRDDAVEQAAERAAPAMSALSVH